MIENTGYRKGEIFSQQRKIQAPPTITRTIGKRKFKPTWEKEKEAQIEMEKAYEQLNREIRLKKNIIKGRTITVTHAGKPWLKNLKRTSGEIIQITNYFFTVRNSFPGGSGYCECFFFIDIINNTIIIDERRGK